MTFNTSKCKVMVFNGAAKTVFFTLDTTILEIVQTHKYLGITLTSRDAPNVFSGDETITRVYTRKATDIRMRTSKKNESGILNQNLCSSNEGYAT